MSNVLKLQLSTEEGDVHVVVETPRGSRAKFAYDPRLKAFVFRKSPLTGLTYPHDGGFAPSTRADDGDPLDIMVIHDATTFPGLVVKCRVIGILEIEQNSKNKAERNDRLFAVPRRSHSELALKDVRDLTQPTAGGVLGGMALAAFGGIVWACAWKIGAWSLAPATIVWFPVAASLWLGRRHMRLAGQQALERGRQRHLD